MFKLDKNSLIYFSKRDGTKIRFGSKNYTKSSTPELVDIKITDFCTFNCAFCYQGSTTEGKDASFESIEFIAKELGKAKVFEVALGGGEPTQHANFLKVLHIFKDNGIIPNYTTKNKFWSANRWHLLKDLIGAFAFSAEKPIHIRRFAEANKNVPKDRVNIHYVMGLQQREDFVRFLLEAYKQNYRVTLLGYKTVGRGTEIFPFPYPWWMKTISDLMSMDKCPTISIDTALAKQYEFELKDILSTKLFHVDEGKFSMYVDAVKMKMGASSYEKISEMEPFDKNWIQRYQKL